MTIGKSDYFDNAVVDDEKVPRIQVVFGITPALLMTPAAGAYLGHCGDWLRKRWAEHDLYKPTIRGNGSGSPHYYHI